MRARAHLSTSRSFTWAGWRYMGRIHGMRVSERARRRSPMSPLPGSSRPYASVSWETRIASWIPWRARPSRLLDFRQLEDGLHRFFAGTVDESAGVDDEAVGRLRHVGDFVT